MKQIQIPIFCLNPSNLNSRKSYFQTKIKEAAPISH
jgi:hypothetical protein